VERKSHYVGPLDETVSPPMTLSSGSNFDVAFMSGF